MFMGPIGMDGAETGRFLQWCRVLYRRILFPAPSSPDETPAAWQWLCVILLATAAMAPGLSMPLFEPDETRYALIPKEMLRSGDLTVPRLDGEHYFDKPPLLYWMVAGVYSTLGDSVPMARLAPAASMLGVCLLTLGFGSRTVGTAVAFRAALVLAASPGLSSMGRLLLMDGPLTLWVLLAQGALYLALRDGPAKTGWWLLSAIGAALGIMTKGPICLILVLAPWAAHRRLSAMDGPGWRAWAAWWLIVVSLSLPWHALVAFKDNRFLTHYILEHHFLRFLQPFDHVRGTFFYVPVVILALFPMSLLLPWTANFLASGRDTVARARTPETGYWFWCASVCLIFFSLSGCKLPTYILPALAPLALVLSAQAGTLPGPVVRWGLAAGLPVCLFISSVAVPWYSRHRDPLACPEAWKLIDDALARGIDSVACYPRPCHAASLRLGRFDIKSFRSKEFDRFRADLMSRPATVVLCTHRHSLQGLKQLLPPQCRVAQEASCNLPDIPWLPSAWQDKARTLLGSTALGFCDAAVIEYKP